MKKRLHILALLLAAWLVVPWSLSAEEYINENFDVGLDYWNPVPDGWDRSLDEGIPDDGNSDYMRWGVSNDYEGADGLGKAYVFNACSWPGTWSVILTKTFTPSSGTQVSFDWANETLNAFEVYITTDGTDVLQLLGEHRNESINSGGNDWFDAQYALNDFSGQTVRLAFKAYGYDPNNYINPDNGWNVYENVYIDNILVKSPDACPQPENLEVRTPGQTTTTIGWTINGTAPQNFKIKVWEYKSNGELTKTFDEVVIDGTVTTHELTGLTPLRIYKVQMVSVCNNTPTAPVNFEFTTISGPQTLPLEEDFSAGRTDGGLDRNKILGWMFDANYRANLDGNEEADRDAAKPASLKLSAMNNATEFGYAMTPQIAHPINDVQLTLKAKGGVGYQLVVGAVYVEAGANPSIGEFVAVDTIVLSSSDWQEYRINTSLFDVTDWGTGDELKNHVIALKPHHPEGAERGWEGTVIYVDDISIVDCPTCPRIERVSVEKVDSVSALLRYFTYSPAAEVEVSLDGTNADAQTLTPAGEGNIKTVKVSGLKANTAYKLYLRSACSDADKGEWSTPVELTTLCGPRGETVFKEDFAKVTSAALPDCWFFESADEMITWKAIFDAQQNNGYVTIDKLASAEVNTQLYVQSVNIDAAGKYDVSFRYQRMENGEKLGSEDSDGTVDASAGKGVKVWISNNPTLDGARQLDFIPLNYELAPAEAVPGWYTYECNIDLTDNVYVIFDANTELCRIDDIEVKLAPACRDPKYIVVKETTATDATITWRGDNRQSAWKVSYTLTDLTGQAQPKVVTDADATGFEYKFTDLTGSTRYRVEGTVTAACGSTNSAAVPFKFDFETVCDPITGIDATPFIEKFDGTLFAPVCWSQNQVKKGDKIGNTDINYRDTAWVRTTEAQYVAEGTGAAMLRAANSGAQTDLISPAIEIPEEGQYRLTFYMWRDSRTTDSKLEVYMSETADVAADNLPIFQAYVNRKNSGNNSPQEVADGWYKYYVDLDDAVKGARRFIFRGTTKADNLYIDEVTVAKVAACDYIDGTITFDSIRYDAVRIYVTGDETVADYQVEVGARGFEPGKPGNGAISKVLSAANPVVDGLTAETDYDVYVRRYCDDANQGEWTQRVARFSTLSNPFEVTLDNEFFDGFESLDINQPFGNPYIHSYEALVEGTDVDKKPFEGIGAYLATQVYPETGTRFGMLTAGENGADTRVLVPMKLKKGSKYEISANIVQDNMDASLVEVQFMYAASLEDKKSELPIGVAHTAGQKWGYVHNFFTLDAREADGTYYVGWNVKVKNPARIVGIDNFRVREVECVPPTAIEAKPSHNGVELSWGEDTFGEKWEVLITTKPGADTEGGAVAVHKTDIAVKQLAVAGDLQANTQYYYYVRSYCGDKPSIWSDEASFRTNCVAKDMTNGLTETFEDPALADFECWTAVSGSYERNLGMSYSGDASLLAKKINLVSPELAVDALNGYVLKGWVYALNDGDKFSVYMQKEVKANTEDMIPVADVTVSKGKRWTPFVVSFAKTAEATPEEQGKYFSIQAVGVENLWFDDITVNTEAACPQPTEPKITYNGGSTVSLSWTDNAEISEWRVEMRRGGVVSFDTVVKTNPATIEGLAALTEYEVYIASICADQTESDITYMGNFRTGCAALPLPFKQNFGEEYYPTYESGNIIPDCWKVIEPSVDGTTDPYSIWYGNLHYGSFTYGNGAENQYSTLRTPFFDLTSVENPQLNVKYAVNFYGTGEDGYGELLISTDGGSNYTVLKTVGTDQTLDSIISLADYATEKNVCFAFKVYSGNKKASAQYLSVDCRLSRFTLSGTETCARPEKLANAGVTANTASVSFESAATSYELVYGNVGIDPNSEKLTPTPLASTSHTIEGLNPSSSYDVYVRNVCEAGKSAWEGPLTVTTLVATTAGLPFAESFEAYDSADELMPNVNYGQTKPNANVKTKIEDGVAFATDGIQGLAFLPNSSEGKNILYRLPYFGDVAALNTLLLEFDYRSDANGENNSNLIGLALVKKDLDWGDVTTNADRMPVANGLVVLEQPMKYSASFVHVEYSLANIPEEYYKDYCIAFYIWDAKVGQVFLDNVRVYVDDSCPMAKLSLDGEPGVNSFQIRTESKAAAVELAYGPAGSSPKNCTVVTADASGVTTVSELKEASSYFVFARGNCGEGDVSEWSTPITVTTQCVGVTITADKPYFEDFDTYGDMPVPFPPCVEIIKEEVISDVSYPMLSKDMTASEPRAMLLRGMSHIAMPELEGIDLSRTTLSFDVMGMSGNGLNGAANFQVGLLAADGEFTNLSKYVAGSDELTADGNVTHIEIDLSEIAYGELGDLAGARYSFKTNIEYIPSGYVYIDNVKAVFAPTCYEPRGLKTSLKMDTALAFEWNTPPDATKFDYILYIGATEQIQEQGTVDKAADAVKADVVFKDLKPNTPYRLRINTVCEYDDLDAVTTGYAEITETTFRRFGRIPYEYGFEDNQNVNDGVMEAENWYRPGADNGQRNIFMIDKKAISTSDDARFGEKSLYITNLRNDAYPESSAKYGYDDNIERTAYAYRTFYLEPGKYSISYDWKANGRSSDGKWNDVECGRVFFAPSTVEFAQNQPAKTDGSLNDLGSAAMIPQGSIVLDKGENLTGKTDWTLQNKVAFEVTEAGMYNLVFAWTNRSQEGVAVGNPLAIDNIVLENQDLETPVVSFVEAKADKASFTWTSDYDTFAIRVLDAKQSEIVSYRDTVYEQKEYTVEGLTTATNYTFEVRAISVRGNRTYISEYAEMPFTTECIMAPTLPYTENFETVHAGAVAPLCWTADGKWAVKNVGDNHRMNLDVAGNAGKAEIVSPAFTIPADDKSYHLTFKYYNNTADAMKVSVRDYTSGETKEVMTDTKAVPAENRWVSLEDYKGKSVQFVFTVDVTETEAQQSVWFDDFRIACFGEPKVQPAKACFDPQYVYELPGYFTVTYNDVAFAEGENHKTVVREHLVVTGDGCDYIYRLELSAGRATRDTVEYRMCEGGEPYVSEAFPKGYFDGRFPNGIDSTGTYTSSLLKVKGTDCDSIVVLKLEVYKLEGLIEKTICEGDSVKFNDVWYSESTEIVDTTLNDNGCDSVTTFRLTVLPKAYTTEGYLSSCAPEFKWDVNGKTYKWDAANQDRIVTDTVKHTNKLGCDSNYVLHLTSLPQERVMKDTICQGIETYEFGKHVIKNPETKRYEFDNKWSESKDCPFKDVLELVVTKPDTTFISDNICQDRPYTEHNLNITATKDTVVIINESTLAGCDSVVKITLDFIETVVVDTTVKVNKEDLPYEFDGRDLVNPGEYTATFDAVSTGCDSVVNLTLEVIEGVGVDNVKVMSLTLAPNPIRTGETTLVHRDWTAEEQNGLRMEIINSVGKTIAVEEPETYPIAINGIEVSGVYYIRITSGTGDVYVGKLVVK